MAFQFTNTLPNNFPQKPSTGGGGSMVFPEDLTSQDRKFYMDIQFMKYDGIAVASNLFGGSGSAGFAMSGGGIRLPLPRTINDVQTVLWEEQSLTQQGLGVGQAALDAVQNVGGRIGAIGGISGALGQIIGSMGQAATGMTLNPYLYMLFKSPVLKQFTFDWILVPSKKSESDKIKDIVKEMKKKMLPSKDFGGAVLKYPDIAQMKLSAGGSDDYLFRFKPAVLDSLSINHTPVGGPSFFKSGASTAVSISAHFKEIEIWTQEDIN